MNTPTSKLSLVCQAALILDLETNIVVEYGMLTVHLPNSPSYHPDAPTRYYLISWPLGLFAYVGTYMQLDELRPSFIEAAHKAAKKLKPFLPARSRWWV